MTLTTVPLSALRAPKVNPRKVVDKGTIAGLAQSIRVDGVLQNLVVRPEGDGIYRIIFGKRRHLALQYLKKEGAIDDAYPVPVDIKEGLDDHDARRIATVENAQREQLHPMDEAEDFAALLQSGGTLETITEKTGLSATTIKRRLAVATLAPQVKRAFRVGTFGRAIAEALTLGSHEQQRAILESLQSEEPPDADEIRGIFLGQKPTLSLAIFPREQYPGTLTTDLFADEETTYFDDVDQFLALQKQAVNALAEERRKTAAWVEEFHLYTVPWWQFREAREDEPSGVVINLHPSGAVEVREGLARHEVEPSVTEATQTSPIAPRPAKERPVYGTELIRYTACQRSAAVQAALLANPRKAKEAAVTLLLVGFRRDFGIRLTVHACHSSPAAERLQRSHQSTQEVTAAAIAHLGFGGDPEEPARHDGPIRLIDGPDGFIVLDAVRVLPDDTLDQLLFLLPVLCLGQDHVEAVDTGESLFNRIAADLGVAMRAWWKPDATFLTLLTREQLLHVAGESGAAAHLTGMNGWTKRRLVDELTAHFADRTDPDKEGDRPAAEWLPGLLRFPAVKSVVQDQA